MSSVGRGLPASRADWRAEVLEAAAQFTCGDVVEGCPYFYVANPRLGVMEFTRLYDSDEFTEEEVIDAGEIAAPFGLITSQTCDIGEIDFDPPSKPFISVSPVFDGAEVLDGSIRSLLRRAGQVQSYVHLPKLTEEREGFWVADLRIEMPVEKSWLVGRRPLQGFATEGLARRLPDAIHAIRSRPAWAQVVVDNVQAVLTRRLVDLREASRETFIVVRQELVEVGVAADSMLTPTRAQVAAFVDGEVSTQTQEWWNQTGAELETQLEAAGLQVFPTELLDLGVCSVKRYRDFSAVGLGRFSN